VPAWKGPDTPGDEDDDGNEGDEGGAGGGAGGKKQQQVGEGARARGARLSSRGRPRVHTPLGAVAPPRTPHPQALKTTSPPSPQPPNPHPQEVHMSHDDKFGEVIPDEEREWLAHQVYDCIAMQVGWGGCGGVGGGHQVYDCIAMQVGWGGVGEGGWLGLFGVQGSGAWPDEAPCVLSTRPCFPSPSPKQDQLQRGGAPPAPSFLGQAPQFAGSQPVSLDREKLEYVKNKRWEFDRGLTGGLTEFRPGFDRAGGRGCGRRLPRSVLAALPNRQHLPSPALSSPFPPRYWVTWKADGTRYLLLLTNWGVYMIDRSCDVRRAQMRFPTALTEERAAAFHRARQKAKRPEEVPLFPVSGGALARGAGAWRGAPGRLISSPVPFPRDVANKLNPLRRLSMPCPTPQVGPPHNWTLMDGEMVVDEVEEGGGGGSGGGGGGGGGVKKQRRR
jgi:hypothetical protein